jgi:hypothetical protein
MAVECIQSKALKTHVHYCLLCYVLLCPAVLNRDNMVGLLYIHDPKCSPEQHASEAQQLTDAFDGQYTMGVFKLKDKDGVQGDLLTVKDGSSGSSGSSGRNASAAGGSNGGSNAEAAGSGRGGDGAGKRGTHEGVAEGGEKQGGSKEGVGIEKDEKQGGDTERGDKEGGSTKGEGPPVKVQKVGDGQTAGGKCCRLLTFQEYLQQRDGSKQQQVSAD